MDSLATNSTQIGNVSMAIERDRFAGPALNWTSARAKLGVALDLHVYSLGSMFAILALWALVHLVRVCIKKDLPSRGYYITMQLLVFIAGTGRAFYILIDVYRYRKLLPELVSLLSKFVNFASITSAFILLFVVLMRLTKMQVVSHRIFSPVALASIVIFNYVLGITTDFLAVKLINGYVFYFVCDTYFVTWGLLSSAAYMYVFKRLYERVVLNRRKLNEISIEASHHDISNNRSAPKKDLDTKMPVAAKITLVTAASFFLIGALNVYRMGLLLSRYHQDEIVEYRPWDWWVYNTFMRLFEITMCSTIACVGSLPFYK